ncbi:hypothetical protein CRUP_027499 [Coryphaenoides rupestris]|nr:hypothetical protein CRUP_027499 [Coryphaenoides rupestris]
MTVQNLLATTGLHPFQSIVPSLRVVLVESIPEGLVFNSSITNPSVYQAWLNLIVEARSSIDISSFYWTLTNKDTSTHEPTAYQGEEVLKRLSEAAGKVSVRIAVNKQKDKSVADLKQLASAGANIRWVNMLRLTEGVLHTKFWIVDKKHIFIGSANMDWRSLTQPSPGYCTLNPGVVVVVPHTEEEVVPHVEEVVYPPPPPQTGQQDSALKR